jgi:hypothetical protein
MPVLEKSFEVESEILGRGVYEGSNYFAPLPFRLIISPFSSIITKLGIPEI